MTDNQPADLLGCYGNTEIHTPNLDLMSQNGLRFENAYCPNAMCSPSRASVWTGLMPCQHGVHTWLDDRLTKDWPDDWNAVEEFETLPEILKRSGFATAMIGKYHLGKLDKAQNGIEHWITMARGHTLDFYNNEMRVNDKTFTYDQHSVDFFSEKAVEYVEDRAASPEQPFFLILPFNGPYGHWPSIKGPATNQFWQLYADKPMNSVPREGINKKAIELYDLQKNLSGPGGPDFSSLLQIPNDLISLRNYYSQMSLIDHGVGMVMNALNKNGLDKNTLVIFTADHGFSLGHHGFWGHGQATWPSNAFRIAYNIPLLIWAPTSIDSGRVSKKFVSSADLYATILDFLEITPEIKNNKVPSRSFAKLLTNEDFSWQDEIYIEQEETRAIRTPEWSYLKRFKGSKTYILEDELYDLTTDPDERLNKAGQKNYAEIEKLLADKLDTFFDQYADPKFDLWNGGTVKSNTSRPWLWKDAWGDDWKPIT